MPMARFPSAPCAVRTAYGSSHQHLEQVSQSIGWTKAVGPNLKNHEIIGSFGSTVRGCEKKLASLQKAGRH